VALGRKEKKPKKPPKKEKPPQLHKLGHRAAVSSSQEGKKTTSIQPKKLDISEKD